MRCPHCRTEAPLGARYCSNCGTSLVLRCSNCDTELIPGARYCQFCGQIVRQQSPDDEALHTRLAAATPAPLADKVRAAPLSGEYKTVTVLFVDVVDSTNLSQQVDRETWKEILNEAFDQITPHIYRYEGTIARTQGDALIAFFGAPVAHEDDPMRAVRAALEALASVRTYSERVHQQLGIRFSMRFCLNTGPIVLGPVSNDLKYEFTSASGAVNRAALLKFAGQPMAVLISGHTYRFIAPFYDCEDQGSMEVKDLGQHLQVFKVLGSKPEPGSLRGIAGLESPMVGRDKELTILVRLCTALHNGLGRVAIVLGEPGLGKTRLIAEWQASIAKMDRSPLPLWAEGRSLPYGQGIPYHLLSDLLHALLGVPEAADEAVVHAALFALLHDLLGDPLQQPALEVYACLGNLLGLQLESEARAIVEVLDPQALQAHYLSALRSTLVSLAQSRPLVLVLEDLHWCDPSSADILVKLLPLVSSNPILFCLVTRPERAAPGWALVRTARELLGNSLAELVLEPLSENHSRQLVANLLELESLPETMRSMILNRAEGNPFFVEEIVRMLIEKQAIVQSREGWVAGEGIQHVAIPDNLQGMLVARIDRLSNEGKQTLRVASVIGRQFPIKVLSEVIDREVDRPGATLVDTLNTLTNLESAGLIRVAQFEPDLEYLFRHSLVQDAAYESILAPDQRRLHLVVGETVEQMYADRTSSRELAPLLGQHFSKAGDDERALKYFSLAGQAALASYANQEAEDNFLKGLSLSCPPRVRLSLLSGLGEAINNQSRFFEAIEVWREAILLADSVAELAVVARLYAWSARAAWWAGDTPLSLQLCQEGIRATADAPESADQALLVHETARAYYFNGVPEQARIYCLQALDMAEHLGDIAVQADSLTTLGILPEQDSETKIDALNRAIELAESAGMLIIASRAHINAGSMRRGLFGDMEGARYHYQKSLEIAQIRGVAQEQLFALGALLSISLELGELNKLEEMLPEFEDLIHSLADQRLARLELNNFQAIIQVMRGEWLEAREPLIRLTEETRKAGNLQNLLNLGMTNVSGAIETYWMGESIDLTQVETQLDELLDLCERGFGSIAGPLAYLSIIKVIQGNLDDAHTILDRAFQNAGDRHEMWLDILLYSAKGILGAAQKKWEESFSDFQEAYQFVSKSGQRWMGGRVLLRWTDALLQRGEPADLDRAFGLLGEAAALFESMRAPVYLGFIELQKKKLRERKLIQMAEQTEIARELAQAKRIQRSFLPDFPPAIPGWSLAAILKAARETSGDYYDFIPLPDDHLGILIADVADKGAGAALFMTSSRTLIRTYAEAYPDNPSKVLEFTNRRLLLDTHAGLFVTLFYAILEPANGTIRYCNAGHNPPFLFQKGVACDPMPLPKTGMPLGILDGAEWDTAQLQMKPGDMLTLYTDGVTEAQNSAGEYYGDERLVSGFQQMLSQEGEELLSAEMALEIQINKLHSFLGNVHHLDDVTLVILRRLGGLPERED